MRFFNKLKVFNVTDPISRFNYYFGGKLYELLIYN